MAKYRIKQISERSYTVQRRIIGFWFDVTQPVQGHDGVYMCRAVLTYSDAVALANSLANNVKPDRHPALILYPPFPTLPPA